MGKGQNVENQNVESHKERQKFEKDQNVESIFKVDQNIERDNNHQLDQKCSLQIRLSTF